MAYRHTHANTLTHCGVNQQTSPVDNCAHKAAVNKDASLCVPSCRSKLKTKQIEINIHAHTYTHYHCIAGLTPRPGCVQVFIPLTVSERHVNQRRRLPAQPYMSLSFLLSLLVSPSLSASICIYSLQSVFTLVKRRFSTSTSLHLSHIPLFLLLFLLELSSHHSKSCLSFCSYVLMHLPAGLD